MVLEIGEIPDNDQLEDILKIKNVSLYEE